MKDYTKCKVLPIVVGMMMVIAFTGISILGNSDYSESERRVLTKAPQITVEGVLSGKYMSEFEEYALDQFVGRDFMRSIKAVFVKDIFLKKDNNDIYVADGYVSKMEYPISYPMLDHATERFDYIYKTYLNKYEIKPYLVIVPDKNYYLAEKNGYLALDYEELFQYVYNKNAYMEHIDIRDKLTIEDYYHTDTHWRQECIVDVADTISNIMGNNSTGKYDMHKLDSDFRGVYYGQSALPLKPDTISYLTSEVLEKCTVTSYDTGKPVSANMYNLKKATGKDSYEMFLEGAKAILTIDNPSAKSDKKLVIFRDSFGSSLAPLLVKDYAKVTLVDIRYVKSSMLGNLVEFENSDVLFEYSTLVLNNSLGLQ